jgi:phenylalanyl-tRNA synthetase alpha chain
MNERADTVAAVELEALESEALGVIWAAANPGELDEARVRYLGRKSPLKLALREVRDRESGLALNRLRETIEAAVEARDAELRSAALERALAEDRVDVTVPGARPRRGRLHLITQIRREVEDIFLGLGYEVYDDREVETTRDNFDALAFPDWHPARSPHDSFYLDDELQTLLRTETSPSQIHVMQTQKPPIFMVSIGRVYRRDTIDATHYPTFHQFEGLAVDRGITLADLKGTLLHVMRQLYGPERRLRFRTHYFPFTEPSMEPDVSCMVCGGDGCPTCKWSGWIEMGGSGVVDPAVLEYCGIDPEEYSGFAFGMGLERTAQLRHGVPDLRYLWEGDLRVSRQFS